MSSKTNRTIFTWVALIFFAGSIHPVKADFDHTHNLLTQTLSEYVNDGKVNYKELKIQTKLFHQYIGQLEAVNRSEFSSWNQSQMLAYWINAYNAFTIELILKHYPIKKGKSLKARLYPDNSIRQIPGVWDEIKVMAGGRPITLNDIEHEVLRKEFRNPRIHFAIVCASVGCPELWNHAYEAENIDAQLEQAAKRFIRDRQKVWIDLTDDTLYLSKIFQWFHKDFSKIKGVTKYGKFNGVVALCYQYFPKAVHQQLQATKLDIKWLDYDWSLNE